MLLKFFQVKMFRNFLDSESIAVEPEVTCLVGKNESGKTALLQSLVRLNPAHGERFDVEDQYPRWLWADDEVRGDASSAEPIQAVFALDRADVGLLVAHFGEGVMPADAHVTLSRHYETPQTLLVDLPFDEARAVSNLVADALAAGDQRAALGAAKSFRELAQMVARLRERAEKEEGNDTEPPEDENGDEPDWAEVEAAIVERLGGNDPASVDAALIAWDVVKPRLPKFFYFSDYSFLPGRLDIGELGDIPDQGPAASELRTAKALLDLAGFGTGALTVDDYEKRRGRLEATSNRLTKQVFDYWRQNEELEVIIDIDMASVPAPDGGLQAVARYLDVRVKDRRHGFTNNFSQRSSGFRWFFSFLAAFSEFERLETPVIILLDEPGLTLHGRAQADFLRFIDERLAPAHQVIYTTHSPFMVDVDKLERVRIVEDKGPDKGAKATKDVLAGDPDSVFPLQAALGYDIARSLFVGGNNLVVEGTSDFTYLTTLSSHLKSLGRGYLDDRWTLVPVGGAQNIPSFVALLGAQLDVTVLVDSGAKGMQRLNKMVESGLLQKKRLITIGEILGTTSGDIEDIFTPGDYLSLYNATYGKSLAQKDLSPGERIVNRIAEADVEFDHGEPADHLLRSRDKVLPSLKQTTLDRFERLIQRLNSTLA